VKRNVAVLLDAEVLDELLDWVPATLGYQGRRLNADGAPVTGVVSLTSELFADPTNGSSGSGLWSETQSIALADGFYSTTLGSTTPVPSDIFDGSSRFLQIAVAGVPLTPRLWIASVPYAHMATVAKSLAAGSPAVAVATGATLASAGVAVTGTSTTFTSQLAAGDESMVGSGSNLQSRLVVTIAIYGRSASLVFNVGSIVDKTCAVCKQLTAVSDRATWSGPARLG